MKFIYWLLLFVAFLVLVTAIIVLVTIFSEVDEENQQENRELFELSIIHFNDFHARFDEINANTLLPCAFNNTEEPCIGGIARLKTMIDLLMSKRKNAIVLNAGDNFQGTFWYNLLRHNVTSYFLNLLPIDANVLGNHEFAHGIEGLEPFLKALNSPILLANLDHRHQLDFDNFGVIKKSIIIERSARKIGIIGVMLREVSEIANVDKLKFTNEIDAIRNESTRLRQMGVNIILVLSHCGLDRDKIIAQECGDYVNVIVGGHSHSFLYTPPNTAVDVSDDVPVGPYPLVVTPKSGRERKVLIVHASAFTKYLGDLRVYFNEAGHVKYYDGNPVYLGNGIVKDPLIDAELVPWRNEVLKLGERIVGNTSVDLIHTECRHGECQLGNLVADALVAANHGIKNVFSSIIHAAGLRNSFHSGDIHYGDIVAAFPFENTLDVLELKGDILYEVFEHSVSRSFVENEFIGIHMLQIAGFKFEFNTTHPVGERVQSLKIKISESGEYETVKNNKFYHVIVPSFLSNGGDGFTMLIKSKRKNQQKGLMLDIDAIEKYITLKSPITEKIVADEQQRIVILTYINSDST